MNWVIHNSPADQVDSKIDKGEIILQIDGKTINSGINPAAILNVIENREVQLTIQSNQKTKRTVVIRPIRYDQARNLLYEQWVNYNQKIVENLSNSRLGYVYIRRMDWSSFERFEKEVYEIGFGKDALVIDVRDNRGGFTTDHLLTMLTQRIHAIASVRNRCPPVTISGVVFSQDRPRHGTQWRHTGPHGWIIP